MLSTNSTRQRQMKQRDEVASVPDALPVRVGMSLAEAEALLISATLRYTQGNMSSAARLLGIDRTTLYLKIKRHDIARPAQR